jgi:hypothetical protein
MPKSWQAMLSSQRIEGTHKGLTVMNMKKVAAQGDKSVE